MASRRSPAASHSRTASQRRVPRGHVFIRNPLQAPKERSCGISITSPSLGSAKRDRLSSSTSYGMRQSRSAEPAVHTQSACVLGCVATAGRHSLLSLSHSFPLTKRTCLLVFMSKRTCIHVRKSQTIPILLQNRYFCDIIQLVL